MVNSRSYNCLVWLQTVYLLCHRRDKDISSTCRYPCSLTATLPIVYHLPTIKVPFRQLMIQLCFCNLVAAFTNRGYDQKSAISRLISHPQSNQVTLQTYWKSFNTLLLHLSRGSLPCNFHFSAASLSSYSRSLSSSVFFTFAILILLEKPNSSLFSSNVFLSALNG